MSINGEIIAPRGTCAQFLDEHRVIYQAEHNGVWTIETCDVRTGEVETLSPEGCNELAAGGGRWVAMLGSKGGVYGSLGFIPGAGVSPTGTDGRGAAGRDGTLAITPDRQSGAWMELRAPDGTITEIRPAAYGLRILGPTQAIWNGGAVGVTYPSLLPGASGPMRVVAPDGRVWWIYWTDIRGLVAHPEGSFIGAVIEALPVAYHPDAVVTPDGKLVVVYSISVGEGPSDLVRVDNVWTLSVQDLSPPPKRILRINRRCWLGFANFSRPSKPQPANCSWDVAFGVPTGLVTIASGAIVAQWLSVEEHGNTSAAYDAAIQAARTRQPRVPVIAYWPRAVQTGPVPRCDHVGVEAYWRKGESLEAFEAITMRAVMRCTSVALVAQVFTSNESLEKDLAPLVPVYANIAKLCPWVKFILGFSGEGRATGLSDHPEILPLWGELFAGITGSPPIQILDPPKPPPPDPPPPDPPPPPEPEEDLELIDMALISEEKLEQYWDAAADILTPLMPGHSRVDLRQGAREASDRYRKHGVNCTLGDMVWGVYLRAGTKPLDAAKVLDPLVDKIVERQEVLRR